MTRKTKEQSLTWSRLHEWLDYNPESGKFTWLISRSNIKKGRIAGHVNDNDKYVRIMINGFLYLAHRLAYFYMTGMWPTQVINHRNGNPSDNRWVNLEAETWAGNTQKAYRVNGIHYYGDEVQAVLRLGPFKSRSLAQAELAGMRGVCKIIGIPFIDD